MVWSYTFAYLSTMTTLKLRCQFYYRDKENDPPQKLPATQQGYRCVVQLWPSKDGRAKFSEATSINDDGRGDFSFTKVEAGEFSAHIALYSDIELLRGKNPIVIPPIVKHSISIFYGEY